MTHTHTQNKTNKKKKTNKNKTMFLCLAAWPANARSACTGVMPRLCSLHGREKIGGGGGGGGEGGQKRRVREGESGGLEEEWGVGVGWGGGAGGVYFCGRTVGGGNWSVDSKTPVKCI